MILNPFKLNIWQCVLVAILTQWSTCAIAAVAVRGSAGSNNGSGSTVLVMTVPTGVVDGDVLIMNVTAVGGTGTTITTPSGWTLLNRKDSGTALAQAIFWRVAVNEGASHAVSISNVRASGTMIALSGARKVSLSTAQYAGAARVSDTSFTAPSLGTWPVIDGIVLAFGGIAYGTTTNTVLTGFTKATEAASTGGGASNRTTSAVQYKSVTSATTEGGETVSTFWTNAAVHIDHTVFVSIEATPAVALNTPDATAFGTDTTPTLEFTGTDENYDDLTYQIQIDTSTSFDSSSYSIPFRDDWRGSASTYVKLDSAENYGVGQCWTPQTGKLYSISFQAIKTGSPTGNAYAKVYAVSGSCGTTGIPTGSALATSDPVDVSTFSSGQILFKFTGSQRLIFNATTTYFLTIEYSGGDTANHLDVWYDDIDDWHWGNMASLSNLGAWSTGSYDTLFEVYLMGPGPTTYAVSGADPGFLNTISGGDTHPFNAGDKVSYTVQPTDPLPSGTYYWRVKAMDATGSGAYGAFSSLRTFTISTGAATPRIKHKVIHSP